MDDDKQKCQCKDCGKTFNFGDEADNEKYCLRCERLSLIQNMDTFEYEELDRLETEREYS